MAFEALVDAELLCCCLSLAPVQIRAYDKATGNVIAEVTLPQGSGTTAAPITYSVGDKQYILVAAGGRNAAPVWVAMTL